MKKIMTGILLFVLVGVVFSVWAGDPQRIITLRDNTISRAEPSYMQPGWSEITGLESDVVPCRGYTADVYIDGVHITDKTLKQEFRIDPSLADFGLAMPYGYWTCTYYTLFPKDYFSVGTHTLNSVYCNRETCQGFLFSLIVTP